MNFINHGCFFEFNEREAKEYLHAAVLLKSDEHHARLSWDKNDPKSGLASPNRKANLSMLVLGSKPIFGSRYSVRTFAFKFIEQIV